VRKIDEIILHCSDSDILAHDDISVIRTWHLARGFNDVGYHYFIKKDGTVQKGRVWSKVGAHCKGRNTHSIGICLHGKDDFTEAQFDSLRELLERISLELGGLQINGHYKYSDKTCPNFDVEAFKQTLWAEL